MNFPGLSGILNKLRALYMSHLDRPPSSAAPHGRRLSQAERVMESPEYKKERLRGLTGIEDEQKLAEIYHQIKQLFLRVGFDNLRYRRNTVDDRAGTEMEFVIGNLNSEDVADFEQVLKELRVYGFPEPVSGTNYSALVIENRRDLEVLRLLSVFRDLDAVYPERQMQAKEKVEKAKQEKRARDKRRVDEIIEKVLGKIEPQEIDLDVEIANLRDPFAEITKFRGFQPRFTRTRNRIKKTETDVQDVQDFLDEVDPVALDERIERYKTLWEGGQIVDLAEEPIKFPGGKVDLSIFPKKLIWRLDQKTGRKKCYEYDPTTKQIGREVAAKERDEYLVRLKELRRVRFKLEGKRKTKLPKSKEEIDLEQRVILYINNLIVWLINDLTSQMRGNTTLRKIKENDADDLYQNAVLGLFYAIDHHDPAKATTGSVMPYIMACMEGYIRRPHWDEYGIAMHTEQIRIPEHRHAERQKFRKIEQHIRAQYPGETDKLKMEKRLALALSQPEVALLPERSGVPELRRLRERLMMHYEEVPYALLDAENLDAHAQISRLAEFLNSEPTQELYVERMQLKNAVRKVLMTLSPREERVLRLRFFPPGHNPAQLYLSNYENTETLEGLALEEIGDKFGVSRERIRQIEGKALRELRRPFRSKALSAYK